MDQDNDSGRRDSENRGPLAGGFIWYLVAIGVAFIFLALFIVNSAGHRMGFTDFEKLVRQCRYVDNQEQVQGEQKRRELDENAFLIVKEGENKVEYRDLDKVVIHETRITAKVTRQVLERNGKALSSEKDPPKKDVSIYVHKSANEESEQRLTRTLELAHIDYEYAKVPDFFANYGFMLVMFGLLLVFFFLIRSQAPSIE